MSITTTVRSINTVSLAIDIIDFVEDLMDGSTYMMMDASYRDAVVDVIGELLDDYVDQGVITQHKEIGDKRNNTDAEIRQGKFTIEIQYKEHNCINLSKIIFFQEKSLDEILLI